MRKNITCKICGAKFNSVSDNAKYCSPACRDQGAKEKRKNWEAENPNYMKDKMREYRKVQKVNTKRPPDKRIP